jgi:hypothetical protein
MRVVVIAVLVFAAVVSVSAVVQAKRSPPIKLLPTGPLPAVNVP